VYIGLRDLDADETYEGNIMFFLKIFSFFIFILSYVLKKFNVKAFTMTDVQSLGIKRVVEESLLHLTIE
jgi:hypothetical protein